MKKAFKLPTVISGICTRGVLSVAQIYIEFLAVEDILVLVPALCVN